MWKLSDVLLHLFFFRFIQITLTLKIPLSYLQLSICLLQLGRIEVLNSFHVYELVHLFNFVRKERSQFVKRNLLHLALKPVYRFSWHLSYRPSVRLRSFYLHMQVLHLSLLLFLSVFNTILILICRWFAMLFCQSFDFDTISGALKHLQLLLDL